MACSPPRLGGAALALLLAGLPARAAAQSPLEPCACDLTPAACDAACDCDLECGYDWEQDECADAATGCVVETEPTVESLEAVEGQPDPEPEPGEPTTDPWEAYRPGSLRCAEDAVAVDGRCVEETMATAPARSGSPGAASSPGAPRRRGHGGLPPVMPALAVLAGLLALWCGRRRLALSGPFLVLLVLVACGSRGGSPAFAWDEAIDDGPPASAADSYLDVFAAELARGEGAAYVPRFHADVTTTDHLEPAAIFSLASFPRPDAAPVRRVAAAPGCGDRLQLDGGPGEGELLGHAAREPGPERAALVELSPPGGCGLVYEVDPEAIAAYLADGFVQTATVGHVWPPGWGEEPDAGDVRFAAAPCDVGPKGPLVLLHADLGEDVARIAAGCPGEVVVGARNEDGPPVAFANTVWRDAGIRTGFVVGHDGKKIGALLEGRGVERTAAYLRRKLLAYDYVIIDAVTDEPGWKDGAAVNLRFRQLLLRLPRRSVIAYLGPSLLEGDGAGARLHDRARLVRALDRRARALSLQVFLGTREVTETAGLASRSFRRAARLLHEAARTVQVKNVNRRAIVAVNLTMRGAPPDGTFLDGTADDLTSLRRQVRALRMGGGRLGAQRGVGWYFEARSRIEPPSGAYTFSELVGVMGRLAGCWRDLGACGVVTGTPESTTALLRPDDPLPCADPAVVSERGANGVTYVFCTSMAHVWKTEDWVHFTNVRSSTTFRLDGMSANGDNLGTWWAPGVIWAPDLDRYVMWVSVPDAQASDGESGWDTRSLAVLTAPSPTGPWDYKGLGIDAAKGQHFIDPFLFRDHDGGRFVYWKQYDGGLTSRIMGARVDSSWTQIVPASRMEVMDGFGGPRTWESNVRENPAVWYDPASGRHHMLFSGGAWRDGSYATGHAISACGALCPPSAAGGWHMADSGDRGILQVVRSAGDPAFAHGGPGGAEFQGELARHIVYAAAARSGRGDRTRYLMRDRIRWANRAPFVDTAGHRPRGL